jgi:putative PIN family toxin of toxin-antitoxin system
VTNNTTFVFDTNTIVSAVLLPRSVTRQAFDYAFAIGRVLASQATLDELDEVLPRAKFDRYAVQEDRLRFLSIYLQDVHIIEVTTTIHDCRDTKDNKFLELAGDRTAACIVSSDSDLFELAPYRGIDILSPSDFLKAYHTDYTP